MKKPALLSLLVICTITINFGSTPPAINTEDHPAKGISIKEMAVEQKAEKELKKPQREENRWLKLEEKINRFLERKNISSGEAAVGLLDDPVNKWFWFWIFGWSLGLIITLISGATVTTGFLGILWLLGFVGGSVALVIWLLKKFG